MSDAWERLSCVDFSRRVLRWILLSKARKSLTEPNDTMSPHLTTQLFFLITPVNTQGRAGFPRRHATQTVASCILRLWMGRGITKSGGNPGSDSITYGRAAASSLGLIRLFLLPYQRFSFLSPDMKTDAQQPPHKPPHTPSAEDAGSPAPGKGLTALTSVSTSYCPSSAAP